MPCTEEDHECQIVLAPSELVRDWGLCPKTHIANQQRLAKELKVFAKPKLFSVA